MFETITKYQSDLSTIYSWTKVEWKEWKFTIKVKLIKENLLNNKLNYQ